MPIDLRDAVHIIGANPNRHQSMHALLDTIASAIAGIGSSADRDAFVAHLREVKNELIGSVEAGLSGTQTNLGPGETPNKPADRPSLGGTMSAAAAEEHGNPAGGRDMSGHKMHPSDALSAGAGGKVPEPDASRAEGFGGSGASLPADRTNAGVKTGSVYRTVDRIEPITGDTIHTDMDADDNVVAVRRTPRGPVQQPADQRNGPVVG
jgi:hypothetical protein